MASWKSRLHTMLLLTQKQGVGFDKGTPKSTDQNMYVCHSISKRYSINSFFYKDALNGEPFYICKCSWRLKSTKNTQIFVLVKKYYLHGKICKSKAIAICFILLNVHTYLYCYIEIYNYTKNNLKGSYKNRRQNVCNKIYTINFRVVPLRNGLMTTASSRNSKVTRNWSL